MSIPINIIINNHAYYYKGNNKYIEILKEQAKPLEMTLVFESKKQAIDAINQDPDKFYNGMIIMIPIYDFIDLYFVNIDTDGNPNLIFIENNNEIDLSELEGIIE